MKDVIKYRICFLFSAIIVLTFAPEIRAGDKELYDEGEKLFKEEKYEEAYKNFKYAADGKMATPELFRYIAECQIIVDEDYESAVESYKKALEAEKTEANKAPYYTRLGEILLYLREPTLAMDCYDRAAKANPKYVKPHKNMAILYERQLKFTEALQKWNAVTEMDRTDKSAVEHAYANDIIIKSANIKSNDAKAYLKLAKAYDALDLDDSAADAYRQVLKTDNTNEDALGKLLDVYYRKAKNADNASKKDIRRLLDAIQYYSLAQPLAAKYLELYSNDKILMIAEACDSEASKWEKYKVDLIDNLKTLNTSGSLGSLQELKTIFNRLQLEKYEKATEAEINRFVTRKEFNEKNFEKIKNAMLKAKDRSDWDGVIYNGETIIKKRMAPESLVDKVYGEVASAYGKKKNIDKAVSTYRELVANCIRSMLRPRAQYEIGEIYRALGDEAKEAKNFSKASQLYDQARQEYAKIAKVEDDLKRVLEQELVEETDAVKKKEIQKNIDVVKDPAETFKDNSLYYQARCYYEMENFTKAIELYTKLISEYPTSNWVDNARYDIAYITYANRKDYEKAIKDFSSIVNEYVEWWKVASVIKKEQKVYEEAAGKSARLRADSDSRWTNGAKTRSEEYEKLAERRLKEELEKPLSSFNEDKIKRYEKIIEENASEASQARLEIGKTYQIEKKFFNAIKAYWTCHQKNPSGTYGEYAFYFTAKLHDDTDGLQKEFPEIRMTFVEKALELYRKYLNIYANEGKGSSAFSIWAKARIPVLEKEITDYKYKGIVDPTPLKAEKLAVLSKDLEEILAVMAMFNTADCYYNNKKLNQPETGLSIYKQIITVFSEPQDPESVKFTDVAGIRVGDYYLSKSDYKTAQEAYKVVTMNSKDNKVKGYAGVKNGECLIELKKHYEAYLEFEKVTKEISNSEYLDMAYRGMGNAMFDSGDYKNAIIHYGKVVMMAKSKLRDEAMFNIINSYEKLENFREAVQYEAKFLALFPTSKYLPEVIYKYGYYNEEKVKDYQRAISEYKKILALVQPAFNEKNDFIEKSQFRIGECYNKTQNYDEAKKYYEMAPKSSEYYPYAQQALARIEKSKDPGKYISILKESYEEFKKAGKHLEAASVGFELADAYRLDLEKNFTQAVFDGMIALLSELTANVKLTDDTKAIAQFAKGELYYRYDKYDNAIKEYQVVLSAYPKTKIAENAVLETGKCYFQSEKMKEAKEYVSKAMNSKQGAIKAEAYYWMGEINFEDENYSEAIKNFDLASIYTENPFADDAIFRMGVAQIKIKNFPKARDSFAKLIKHYNIYSAKFPEKQYYNEAVYNIADCYYADSQWESAIDGYDTFLASCTQAGDTLIRQATENRLIAFSKSGNEDRIWDVIRNEKDLEIVKVHYFILGEMRMTTQKYDGAVEVYREFLGRFPSDTDADKAQYSIGVCYLYNNAPDSAKYEMGKLYDYKNSKYTGDGFYRIAAHYFDKKQYDLSVRAYAIIIKQFPDAMDVFIGDSLIVKAKYYTAYMYDIQNKKKEAVAMYKELLSDFPSSGEFSIYSYFNLVEDLNSLTIADTSRYESIVSYGKKFIDDFASPISEENKKYVIDTDVERLRVIIGTAENALATFGETEPAIILARKVESLKKMVDDEKLSTKTRVFYQRDIAMTYYNEKMYDTAIKEFSVISEKFYMEREFKEEARYMISVVLWDKGETDGSIENVESYVQNYKDSKWVPDAINFLLDAYKASTKLSKADALVRAVKMVDFLFTNNPQSDYRRNALIKKGTYLSELGNHADAALAYKSFIDTFPEDPMVNDMRFSMYDAYRKAKQYDVAIAGFLSITDSFPDAKFANGESIKTWCLFQIGITYLDMKEYSKSVSMLYKVKKDYKDLPIAGNAMYKIQNIFSGIISDNADSAVPDYSLASTICNTVINEADDNEVKSLAQYFIGENLYKQDKQKDAIEQYKKAVENFPSTQASLDALVRILQISDETANSKLAEYAIGKLENITDPVYKKYGLYRSIAYYFKKEDFKTTTQKAEKYAQEFPDAENLIEVYYYLVTSNSRMDKFKEAVSASEKGIVAFENGSDTVKSDANIKIYYGYILFELTNAQVALKKHADAVKTAVKLFKHDSKSDFSKNLLIQLGNDFYNKQDYKSAIDAANALIKNTNDQTLESNARYIIGFCYLAQKKNDDAIDEFKKVTKGDNVPDAMLRVAIALNDKSDYNELYSYLSKNYKKIPKSNANWYNIQYYIAAGAARINKADEAREICDKNIADPNCPSDTKEYFKALRDGL